MSSSSNMQQNQAAAAEAPLKRTISLKKNVTPKDFCGPVKPASGFMLFSNDKRQAVGDEYRATLGPNDAFKVAEVAKQLGELWKNISEQDKEKYTKAAADMKAQYESDLAKWQTTDYYRDFVKASAAHSKKKADKKATDKAKQAGLPKRPMAGFMRYCGEIRDEVRGILEAKGEKYSIPKGATITKEKWVALGAEGQAPYNEAFKAAMEKYHEDLKAFKEGDAGKEFAKAKATAVKRKATNEKIGSAPKKMKKSASVETADSAPAAEEPQAEEPQAEEPQAEEPQAEEVVEETVEQVAEE